jgi:hypothetical protein
LTAFEPPTLVGINEPETCGRILLFHLTETQRFQEVGGEAEIGQPNVFEIDAESEVIKFLAGSSLHGRQFSSHISAVWAGVRTSILI